VYITYAAESGSRAWGFASPDSDYDVRFIYWHDHDWYLDLFEHRDTIEWMSDDKQFDFVGWDIRKALRLLYKSNPSLIEWLTSNQIYVDYNNFKDDLLTIANDHFSQKAMMFHYYSMAYGNWKKYIVGRDAVALKKYFYVIRPLLNVRWIQRYGTIPPIDFETVLNDGKFVSNVYGYLNLLLQSKRETQEAELVDKQEVGCIKDFIMHELRECQEAAQAAEPRKIDINILNHYFNNFIRKSI
jgi:hypothetical protein